MTLRSQLDALAASFANQIMAALKGASLQELVGSQGEGRGGGRRADRADKGAHPDLPSEPLARSGKNGRLRRRSEDEIQAILAKVVLLVKTHKEGMRAEEIRVKLGLLPKEMPRILKQGIATKKLTSKGNKRATTYFAK
jgi:hypothetical protein